MSKIMDEINTKNMPVLYTIGYASTTPEELASMLDELHALLVDIRIKP